jgi:alpha-tubulin suppressor-like RCC1 family protein
MSREMALRTATARSCALLNDGTVWRWGWAEKGQLDNGVATHQTTPVSVLGLP